MAAGGFEFRRWAMARVNLVTVGQVTTPQFAFTPQPAGTKAGDQLQNVGNFVSVVRTPGGSNVGDFTLQLAFPLPESQRHYSICCGSKLFSLWDLDQSATQDQVRVEFFNDAGTAAAPASFDIHVDAYPAH